MEDGYIIDAKTRKKALKFKGEYEGLFKEMSGIMHRRADVVNAYMDGAGLWKDPEAILDPIDTLPGCMYRYILWSRYYEAGGSEEKPQNRARKVDQRILEENRQIAAEYREKEKRLKRMEEAAEKEFMQYLRENGLWDDLEAVHEMRCCLPQCYFRKKVEDRYSELLREEG